MDYFDSEDVDSEECENDNEDSDNMQGAIVDDGDAGSDYEEGDIDDGFLGLVTVG